MKQHARIGASSMGRQLACTGSLEHTQETSSEYAEAGTAFAKDIELVLNGDKEVKDVDPDHQGPIQEYLDWESKYVKYGDNNIEEFCEERLGNDEFGGTPDRVVIDHDDMRIWIVDFKFGALPVYAEKNAQLATYLKLFIEQDEDYRNYDATFVIFQPNSFDKISIREWDLQLKDWTWFADFSSKVDDLIAGRLPKYYSEGDHCVFCPGSIHGSCPLKQATIKQGLTTIGAPTTPAISELSDDQLTFLLEHGRMLKKFIDDAEKHSWKRLNAGNEITGLKLVETLGNRRWKPNTQETVEAGLGDEAYKLTLVSPAQAEKLGLDVSDLTERPKSSKVVLEGDKRPAVGITKVDDSDFDSISPLQY